MTTPEQYLEWANDAYTGPRGMGGGSVTPEMYQEWARGRVDLPPYREGENDEVWRQQQKKITARQERISKLRTREELVQFFTEEFGGGGDDDDEPDEFGLTLSDKVAERAQFAVDSVDYILAGTRKPEAIQSIVIQTIAKAHVVAAETAAKIRNEEAKLQMLYYGLDME